MAEYLKLPEVARRLNVSEKTARRYVKTGALPSIFIGGAYRVSEEDLESYLEDARFDPGKAPSRSPLEPSLNDVLKEERRPPLTGPWKDHMLRRARRWEEAATAGVLSKDLTVALLWYAEVEREFAALIDAAEPIFGWIRDEAAEGRLPFEETASASSDLAEGVEALLEAAFKARGRLDEALEAGVQEIPAQDELDRLKEETDRLTKKRLEMKPPSLEGLPERGRA